MSFFKKIFSKEKKETLDKGLEKSKESFFGKLSKAVVGKSKVDDDVLDNLEEVLVSSDVGVNTTLKVIDRIEERVARDKYVSTDELNTILREEIAGLLSETNVGNETEFAVPENTKPYVMMVVGVNGVGKTTTIGKLAHQFKQKGLKVVLGAADTFRAAAIDQLQVWATKVKVDIIKSEINSDPASVAFKTAEFAKKNQIDIALIDTAGRLQNKKNLMEEYKKIINVLKKIDPSYPNEVILVLDATTGQNALNQVEEFSKIHDLTGLIITKLDSTAKGGVVLAICKKYKLPIVAIGMGEKETDLHLFNAEYFSKALLGIED